MRQPLADKKSYGKLAKQGVAISFLREGAAELLFFPASMVLARLLTPAEFGIAVAASFFVLLANRLAELGFNAALVRSKVITPIHLSTVFVLNMVLGLIWFVLLTAAAPLVGRFYGVPETGQILPVAALGFLIAPLGSVPAAILTREMRFKEKAVIEICHAIAFAGMAVILAWLGFSFWSLVWARIGAGVVQTIGRFYFARWRPSVAFSFAALREMMPFAAGMHVRRLLEFATLNLDNLLVGRLMGMVALGFYDKAFSVMNRFLSRMNTGGPGVMFRIFALIHEDPARFRRAYAKVVMSTTLMGLPVFAVLAATAPQLMVALFGEQWLPAALPFQLLCLVGVLRLLNNYASSAIQAAGHVWSEVGRQIMFVALVVALLIAFRNGGPAGAAAGVVVANGCMTVLMHVLLKRVTHLTWMEILRPQVPAVLCAAVSVGSVLAVEVGLRAALGQPSSWLLLACQAPAAVLAYGTFMIFAPHGELRALVHEVASDLAPASVKRHPWARSFFDAPSVTESTSPAT